MKISSSENGPNLVEGAARYLVVREGREEVIEREVIALCRCGQSSNKPFCDGTHRKIGFTAPAAEIEAEPTT